jgi:hypothetical protein
MPDAVSDLDVAIAFENPQVETIKTYGILYRDMNRKEMEFYYEEKRIPRSRASGYSFD